MIRAFRILRASLSAWYYDLFVLIGANFVWLVLSLLIIPIGPATAGLFYICNEVAKGEPISFKLFWVGMRRFGRLSLKLSLALVIILILLIVNITFYINSHNTVGQIVGVIWIYALVFYAFLLNYPFALMVQMDKPGLIRVLRNSTLIAMDNIVFTLSVSILTVLIIFLSIFPLGFLPFLLGFFALLAIFQCKCVAMLIEKYDKKEAEAASTRG